MAKVFGCKAKILMPAGSVEERAQRIRDLGADCTVMKENYDECNILARKLAKLEAGLNIQDTALEGDTQEEQRIPLNIMQGYMTILQEFQQQRGEEQGPTHVFLQAGVGSFSGGLAAHLHYIARDAKIVIVEPKEADCIFRSATLGNGDPQVINGEMPSIMAGLCCGIPSIQGWPILRNTASAFLSCEDSVTSAGMRVLYSPRPGDPKIVSGESGAVTLGALVQICTQESLKDIRKSLDLTSESRVLLVSTEADTDPEGFWDSIWSL